MKSKPKGKSLFGRALFGIMSGMGKLMPPNDKGEFPLVVRILHRQRRVADYLSRVMRRVATRNAWPVLTGSFQVGDPNGAIAICTLSSNDLIQPLSSLSGVAICGRLYTVNLGIERIVANIISNPKIRVFLVCGKDSPVFHTAQGLRCLFSHGVDQDRRIIGADGHYPCLSHLEPSQIESFRNQVHFVEMVGETSVQAISSRLEELGRQDLHQQEGALTAPGLPPPYEATLPRFKKLRAGGHREPLQYDDKGFFLVSLDRLRSEIVLHHYLPNNTPAHEMRGRSPEGMLLGLLREDLISLKSHVGYLGIELAKAHCALRFDLVYEQDQPLRSVS